MYEFDDDKEEHVPLKLSIRNWPELLVKGIGVILLLTGLWSSIHVLLEALQLYRDPVKVERLADAIERGSHLDRNLATSGFSESAESTNAGSANVLSATQSTQTIRLTYFIAWIVALLILLLVSMISFAFLRTGGELVLQDKQAKRYLSSLLKDINSKK